MDYLLLSEHDRTRIEEAIQEQADNRSNLNFPELVKTLDGKLLRIANTDSHGRICFTAINEESSFWSELEKRRGIKSEEFVGGIIYSRSYALKRFERFQNRTKD